MPIFLSQGLRKNIFTIFGVEPPGRPDAGTQEYSKSSSFRAGGRAEYIGV